MLHIIRYKRRLTTLLHILTNHWRRVVHVTWQSSKTRFPSARVKVVCAFDAEYDGIILGWRHMISLHILLNIRCTPRQVCTLNSAPQAHNFPSFEAVASPTLLSEWPAEWALIWVASLTKLDHGHRLCVMRRTRRAHSQLQAPQYLPQQDFHRGECHFVISCASFMPSINSHQYPRPMQLTRDWNQSLKLPWRISRMIKRTMGTASWWQNRHFRAAWQRTRGWMTAIPNFWMRCWHWHPPESKIISFNTTHPLI